MGQRETMDRRGYAVKIDTLYEFLLLASTLNFTETAKNFFVSQSVLSNHIVGLERELGVRLFDRNRHSVRLTEVGALFVDDAKKIIADYENAVSRIAHYRDGITSRVAIGFLLGSFGSFLPEACRRYSALHPDVEFEFRELEIGGVQNRLSGDAIDIGFTLFSGDGNSNRYEYRCLYRDRYKLAVPRSFWRRSLTASAARLRRRALCCAMRGSTFATTIASSMRRR